MSAGSRKKCFTELHRRKAMLAILESFECCYSLESVPNVFVSTLNERAMRAQERSVTDSTRLRNAT